MITGDPIVIKIIERYLKRRLTELERRGECPVRCGKQIVFVPQVNLLQIHNKNSVK